MLKRILVPLDGSASAERAIALAAHVARASGGMLILLRVVGSAIETWPSLLPPLPSAAVQTMIEVGRAEATNYLETVARSNHLEDIEMRNEVLSGPVASTILSVARSRQVDLIIMSSHGSTGSTRWGLGSVVEKVTRHSPAPVLVLPDGKTGKVGADTSRPLRALVPLDGSPLAEAALIPASQLVSALATPAQGVLHIALVAKLPPAAGRGSPKPMDSGMREYLQREAGTYVTAVADRLHRHTLADHLLITWSISFDADVANAVIRLAENGEDAANKSLPGASGCDLIVMTTHGRGGAQPWTMGSVTARVLGATRLPLLIVPCLKSAGNSEPQREVIPQQEDVSQLVKQNMRLGV